jgi:hemoglobin/transferrin/lactoferrin receptor protein
MLASFDYYWRLTKIKSILTISLLILIVFIQMQQQIFAADDDPKNVLPQKASDSSEDKTREQTQQVESESADTLPEVSVRDRKIKEESGINPTLPITTITNEHLQRTQSSNIFDAVRSVPGVSISGGPRASGMTFSIRGFVDNEDVTVKVDGAPKAFEKYRMGGTFVEPEMLRSIEVQRGPQISSGSGALGGTIIAETKNASDFLKPGQKVGAKAKFGYGNNNDEYTRSYMLYARPDERIDILYNYSNRQSNDLTLADGSKLDSSAIETISQLLKVSIFPTDDIELITSLVKFEDKGLQQYDAAGGEVGSLFGTVIRAINDFSWTETLKYTPDNPWINFKAVVAGGYTDLHDAIEPGKSIVNPFNPTGCVGTVNTPNPANIRRCPGNVNDYYYYKTKTIDLSNTAILFRSPKTEISLLTGWQYNERERDVSRFYDNLNYSGQVNYPDGFNSSVPPGDRSFKAFYVQPNFQLGQVNVKPGYRRDDYEVIAKGGSLDLLNQFGQNNKYEFTEETFSLGLAYDFFPHQSPEQLTLYSNYGQGFRAPLLEQAFAPYGSTPGANCPGPYMASGSGMCGNLIKPQTSESTEIGISYQNPRLFGTEAFLTSKINYYHIYTSNLLLSMQLDKTTRGFVQDGWERRNGIEFESFLQYKNWFMRGSYSRISGQIYSGQQQVPLFTIPGNALNINIGTEITKGFDVNLSYRKVSNRNILLSGIKGRGPDPEIFLFSSDYWVLGNQDGYELWNAGAHWQVNSQLGFRVIGENLKNTPYRLDSSSLGGLGLPAAGRNVKFIVEMMY